MTLTEKQGLSGLTTERQVDGSSSACEGGGLRLHPGGRAQEPRMPLGPGRGGRWGMGFGPHGPGPGSLLTPQGCAGSGQSSQEQGVS